MIAVHMGSFVFGVLVGVLVSVLIGLYIVLVGGETNHYRRDLFDDHGPNGPEDDGGP